MACETLAPITKVQRVFAELCCLRYHSQGPADMAVRTAFTEAFQILHPLVGAPMAGVSGPALAAAVANAGGLGYLGAAFYKDPSQLRM